MRRRPCLLMTQSRPHSCGTAAMQQADAVCASVKLGLDPVSPKSFATAAIPTFEGSTERQGRTKLIVAHTRKIIARIHILGPTEEEFVECFQNTGTQWIINASQGYLRKERLRARNGNILEVIWEYPRPVRNEMIPCEGYARVTACDHLGKVAVHDAKATWKTRHFRREESVGRGLPKQILNS